MAQKAKQKTNTALRQWARGVSFTIAMGRRQVFTLVCLHLSAERPMSMGLLGGRHRHMSNLITSAHCLDERGLLIPHVWRSEQIRREAATHKYGDLWQLTRAGELVIELLKEAGIYAEVQGELEASDRLRLRMA